MVNRNFDIIKMQGETIKIVLIWFIMQQVAVNFLDVLDSWPLKMGPIGCPEPYIRNYHYSLCNNPEEQSSQPVLCSTE